MSVARTASRTENSVVPARYLHDAVIDVARMRSSVSGSVVYSSRGNPENAESVVFRITRLVRPETTTALSASRVIDAVQSPALVCTKVCGCSSAWMTTRDHGCSTAVIVTRDTDALVMK